MPGSIELTEGGGTKRKEVLEKWKDARSRLRSAVQAFCDASIALDHDSTRRATSVLDGFHLEENLETLSAELQGLDSDNERLRESCTSLKATTNLSKRLAPINRLPIEILSRIFAILTGWDHIYCDQGLDPSDSLKDWKSYAVVLSSISNTWRRLMVNTPSFWAHIDARIDIDGWQWPTEYTKLCLQRTKNTPINLHVSCNIRLDHEDEAPGITTLTFPEHLQNQAISTFWLELNQPLLVQPILLAWQNSTPANKLESLKIKLNRPSGDLYNNPYLELYGDPDEIYNLETPSGLLSLEVLHERIGSNFTQLHTLNLTRTYTDWNQLRFPGLVDFELSNIHSDFCPSIGQLLSVLAASPELSTLRIIDVAIGTNDSMELDLIAPVNLRKLTFLGLGDNKLPILKLLLRLIEPPSDSMVLNITYTYAVFRTRSKYYFTPPEVLDMLEPIEAFCIRHRISTLSLSIPALGDLSEPLARFLCSLRHLQTLSLSNLMLNTKESMDLFCAQAEKTRFEETPPLRPTLRRLRLGSCAVTLPGLRRIVATHSIRWLRMDYCTFYPDENIIDYGPGRSESLRKIPSDFLEWLEDTVPEVFIDHCLEPNVSYPSRSRGLSWWLSPK